ncbi:coiled-coil domain-containing protein 186 [Scaptodrosophila lebanonensis]|uniref:Coiled-coil domain-containing protein 186 n=1 Tax=Drosophila lebanonensis TaxID=7225 RepID=A0A6J2U9W3_DROLE|nr:coiled-coil domain-containing protein 186 [Scaptodrosophila lebanonensis]
MDSGQTLAADNKGENVAEATHKPKTDSEPTSQNKDYADDVDTASALESELQEQLEDGNKVQSENNTKQEAEVPTIEATAAVSSLADGIKAAVLTQMALPNSKDHDPSINSVAVSVGVEGAAQPKPLAVSMPTTPSMPAMRFQLLQEQEAQDRSKTQNDILSHVHCLAQLEEQRRNYELQLEQLRTANAQKDNMMTLYQRENAILEKEKLAFRKEMDMANKEKEATVIKFAMKEKLLIDAKKDKEAVEKQLADAKKEVKNVSMRFQAVHEEKSRMTYIIDEKCNEVRKYQRECEKLKTEMGHLESKLKYHVNKLNIETEAKAVLERKLEEERNAPNKLEEKANEKLKVEFEANTILLKHEITSKTEVLEKLSKDQQKQSEVNKELQQQLLERTAANEELTEELTKLREEHNAVEAAYSDELLNSAKLRGQLDELQLLRTQNTINEEKLGESQNRIKELELIVQDNDSDLSQLRKKEQELLSINMEMSELIVRLQNDICLAESKAQGLEAENKLLKQERLRYDGKYRELEQQLRDEAAQKNEERQLLARHLSEKTKLYELTKTKLENVQGDFEATQNKHATVVRELQRELQKYKKGTNDVKGMPASYCSSCHQAVNGHSSELRRTYSRTSSHGSAQSGSRRASESSESEAAASSVTAVPHSHSQVDMQAVPSKKVLVERILRLQQATARQTERIEFLENHTAALVAEVQKKSKVVQHYMLRDQTAGALTSSKSDQNKSDLVKYGNGIMAAIYGGVKGGEHKGMTLELSTEINKKLQTVLEDTLLKNITLKENLDVLGLEVDNLTRKLRAFESMKGH